MRVYTFDDVERKGLLLYRYFRGSQVYGTAVPGISDWDEGGAYLEPIEQVLGLGNDFQEEISDKRHDKVWYGFRKYLNLMCKSNPNILESLFVDDKFVIYQHPIITELKEHRQEFVTKECFNSMTGYAVSQIKKAKGYNKLCVNQIEKRLWPLDFCYTANGQGSVNMREWLGDRGMEQKYCGLVSLNNMPMCYGVYYDYGAHNTDKYGNDFEAFRKDSKYYNYIIVNRLPVPSTSMSEEWFAENNVPFFYRGIVREDGNSDDVRCSSVGKDVSPICTMTYNKNGFETHCRKYKEYTEWVEKRNPARYSSNLGFNYDQKNMSHCLRLINMGIEIAKTGEVHVNRTGIDADFLRDVRNHKYTYEELMSMVVVKKEEFDKAVSECTLPDSVPEEFVNDFLIYIRRKYQLPAFTA